MRICSQAGTTVIFVTHQIEEAVYLGDRIAVMSARPGRIATIIDVDLPRPRPPAVKREQRFNVLAREIENIIHGKSETTGGAS